jgi:ribosomal-protein-alanine N-acetyltransferase
MVARPPVRSELCSPRLLLREWRDDDLPAFAALNADPTVMEFFPSVLSPAESDATATRIRQHAHEHGFGLWAVELPGIAPFIGFLGLSYARFPAASPPAVEVGWRLAAEHWGRGYATEGARVALEVGFTDLGLDEIIAITAARNARSRRVMERLGMRHAAADDFDHPKISEGHALRHHVVYRLSRAAWQPDPPARCDG